MSFNIFGSATTDDIRVGYISTDRGFVDGVSVCQANDYAKKNPGTQFIFRTRDEIQYLNINEVNSLIPEILLPKSAQECPGIELESQCGPAKVYFYGGGGVGAKGNPIIGKDGSLLAVDLVYGGFGYQYAPVTKVKDNCGIGAGTVVRSVLGEIVESVEYYDQEDDFEEYNICPPTESGYGRVFSPEGKDIGEWDPTLYANFSKDPIRREIQEYQKFLASLQGGARVNTSDNTIKRWWTTRTETPLSVTSLTRTTRVKHDVRHPGWGGEYAQGTLLKEETFKIFTSGGSGRNLAFYFTTEDKSHAFVIKADDFKENRTGQLARIKVKPNVVYLVSSSGQYKGKGTEIGLIDSLGKKPDEINIKSTSEDIKGKAIFADFLESANDNDDLQVEAGIGGFSATRIGGKKGRTTYNVRYVFKDNSAYKPEVIEDSFMNNHAISPVPPSNVPGTDFAGITFTMEWEKEFPYDGEYIFKGMGDNIAKIYLDNELLFTATEFRKDHPPHKLKKTVKEGVHKIRADLYNTPITEKVIKQQPTSTGSSLGITYTGLNSKNKTLNVRGNNVLLKDGDGDDTNATFSIVSSDSGVNAKFSSDGKSIEYSGSGKVTVRLDWSDNPSTAGVAVQSISVGGVTLTQKGERGSVTKTFSVSKSTSKGSSASTQSQQSKTIFSTVDYIGKANRKLWRCNVYGRGGFINEYGVSPFDTTVQLDNNPYAGTHRIVWDNVDFPVDGNYNIELEVDDNVTLALQGPDKETVITKKGFTSSGASTGKTTETRALKKGKYRIVADLQQIPGGRFGFTDIKGINPMALAIKIESTVIEKEVISKKSWVENPMGVALVIDAPLPPIPQEPVVEQEGRCPRNPIWSTRFPGAKDKWYPVNFRSPKTVTETNNITTTPVTSTTEEVEFEVTGRGAFKDLSFVFTAVTGKHTFTLNSVSKNKAVRKEKVRILKNTNYVVVAKEDSNRFTSVEQGLIEGGTKNKEQGKGESKKIFADYIGTRNDNDDIQISTSLGVFKSSNKRKVSGNKGRNTYDLTYRLDAAPGQSPTTTTKTTTYQVPGWSTFMNRYAISPVLPLSQLGSDGGGIVYKNSWSLDIPYDGFYALRGTVDNGGRVLIDGKEIARGGSISFKGGNTRGLDGFGTENPQSTKVFLTKGLHSIEVEIENQKTDTFAKVDKKVFDTKDWIPSPPTTQKVDVDFNVSSSADFSNSISIPDLNINLSKTYKGNQIKQKLKRSVEVGKVYTVTLKSPESKKGLKLRSRDSVLEAEESTDNDWTDIVCAASQGRFFDFKNGKNEATCKFTIDAVKTSGSYTKNGVTYNGPVLASYRNGTLGPFLTPAFNGDEDYRTNNMDKTWNLAWKDVDFPVDGQYTLRAEADDELIVKVDGVDIGVARVFEGVRTFNFNVSKGKRKVEMEIYNIPGNNRSTFDTNPVVFNAVITVPVDQATGVSKPWAENPIGISAILIPPPCPKVVKGKGVITEVIVEDPGNGNPSLPNNTPPQDASVISYPVTLRLKSVVVENPGINHNCGVDEIQITPSNGAVLSYDCDSFGRIRSVNVLDPGLGFTSYPDISMVTDTGVNARFRPQFEVVRDPIVADPEKLIQVTDLVGLKQTGYVDGRAYFGAVFYKDNVRYAGFYETPGELVQVYDTLQESIEAQVTTRPSAILRQGTDTNSNNPRLNLPGTPDTLI